jgi:hypothetical protein
LGVKNGRQKKKRGERERDRKRDAGKTTKKVLVIDKIKREGCLECLVLFSRLFADLAVVLTQFADSLPYLLPVRVLASPRL